MHEELRGCHGMCQCRLNQGYLAVDIIAVTMQGNDNTANGS